MAKASVRNDFHHRIKVGHVISGLGGGGAENMMYRLLSRENQVRFESEVISLTDGGELAAGIDALGVKVTNIGMTRGIPDPFGTMRLRHYLKARGFDVIQTWMYHADLIGGLAVHGIPGTPIVWNLRAGIVPFSIDPRTYLVTKACAALSSRIPNRIICCSASARRAHEKLGYDMRKMVTIPNGFEVMVNRDRDGADLVRRELGIAPETQLIGMVTRFDRRKDLPNFFRAAAILHKDLPSVEFLLCGSAMVWENKELVRMASDAGVADCCHLLGRRHDIERLNLALDVATLSSASEAFPNVLGEAMACGVPCVATDVGDTALIVGDTGIIVPARDPEALATGWKKILIMSRDQRVALGLRAQRRIGEYFGLPAVVSRYEELYTEIASSVTK